MYRKFPNIRTLCRNLFEWRKCVYFSIKILEYKFSYLNENAVLILAKFLSMHRIVYSRLRNFYVHFEKIVYSRNKKISHYILITIDIFASRKSYVEGNIHGSGSTERHTWPPIIPASHPTAASLSPLLSPPPKVFPTFSVLTDHLGQNTGKDNSDIIPPILKQSEWTRRIDPCRRTTHGLPRGLACQLTSPKAGQIIKRRLLT